VYDNWRSFSSSSSSNPKQKSSTALVSAVFIVTMIDKCLVYTWNACMTFIFFCRGYVYRFASCIASRLALCNVDTIVLCLSSCISIWICDMLLSSLSSVSVH
jgi:hypothetical protein